MPRLYQGSFSAGELSPAMWGRIDADRFQSGVRIGRNVFFRPEGGADKRPGLRFTGYGIESLSANARLIPFAFNNEQTYAIVAQPSTISFIKDGGFIIRDKADSFTSGSTVTMSADGSGLYINTSSSTFDATAMAAGEPLFWVSGGYEEAEGRWFRISSSPAPTTNRVYLADFITGSNVTITGWTSLGTTIDFGLLYYLETADGWFNAVDVSELDFSQANDTLYVSHPDGATKVITRTGDTAWTIADFDPSPSISAPTAAEDTLTGSIYDNTSNLTKPAGSDTIDYAVTAIDSDTFEESLATTLTVSSIDIDTMAGPPDTGSGACIAVTHQSGADTYRIYKSVGGIYGLIGSLEFSSGSEYFQDIGYTANLSIAPPLEVNPAFGSTDNYPGAVELFQQRIWLGRTNSKLRDLYGSRAGSFSSFSTTTVNTADDPIVQQISAKSVHEVRYFVPLRDLVILTSDGVWGFDTGDAGTLTPDAGLVAQNFWGSARVKPVLVGNSAIYVGSSGNTVRDLAFSLQDDGFASSDLTLLAKHLFAGRTIVSVCYSEVPYSVLFCVMSDGQAVSCTYVRDQQIFAWARHDTKGKILDCASVREDGVDNIYVVTERTSSPDISSNVRWRQIERMVMTNPIFIDNGVYLDNSVDLTQGNDYATAETLNLPRVRDDELEMCLPDTVADDAIVQLRGLGDTPLSALDDLSFMVDATDADQTGAPAGRDYYRMYRHNSGANKTLFRWEDYFPEEFIMIGQTGSFDKATTDVRKCQHLYQRGSLVSIRAEGTMFDGVSVSSSGRYTLASDAALIHVGELYTSEIETLDIDDVNDPITGLPLQIGGMLLRFELCRGLTTGRSRNSNALYVRSDVTNEEDYSLNLGGVRGVIDQTQYPTWNRSGRMIIRSKDGFPWKLSAVIPKVEAGDVDA